MASEKDFSDLCRRYTNIDDLLTYLDKCPQSADADSVEILEQAKTNLKSMQDVCKKRLIGNDGAPSLPSKKLRIAKEANDGKRCSACGIAGHTVRSWKCLKHTMKAGEQAKSDGWWAIHNPTNGEYSSVYINKVGVQTWMSKKYAGYKNATIHKCATQQEAVHFAECGKIGGE